MEAKKTKEIDFVVDILKEEYNAHAGQVEHFREMADMASTAKVVQKWSHLGRIAQKINDDLLAILYAYKESKSLRRLCDRIGEAIAERRALINWLEHRPSEERGHMAQALVEVGYFIHLRRLLLHAAAKRMKGTERQCEARALLAAYR